MRSKVLEEEALEVVGGEQLLRGASARPRSACRSLRRHYRRHPTRRQAPSLALPLSECLASTHMPCCNSQELRMPLLLLSLLVAVCRGSGGTRGTAHRSTASLRSPASRFILLRCRRRRRRLQRRQRLASSSPPTFPLPRSAGSLTTALRGELCSPLLPRWRPRPLPWRRCSSGREGSRAEEAAGARAPAPAEVKRGRPSAPRPFPRRSCFLRRLQNLWKSF